MLKIKSKNLNKGEDISKKSILKPKQRKNKVKPPKKPILPSTLHPAPSSEEKGDCNVQDPLKLPAPGSDILSAQLSPENDI